jgi:hypothetical protein
MASINIPVDLLDHFAQFDGMVDPELVPNLERSLQSAAAKIFEQHGLRGFEARRSDAVRHEIGHAIVAYHDGCTDIKELKIFGDTVDGVEMWSGRVEWKMPAQTITQSDHNAVLKHACAAYAGYVAERAITNPEGKPGPASSLDEIILAQFLTTNLTFESEFTGFTGDDILQACALRCYEILGHNEPIIEELMYELEEKDNIGTKRLKQILGKIERVPELLEPGWINKASKNMEQASKPPKERPPLPDLPPELLPVKAFDYELMPEALRPWVKDISERMQCPADYVGAAAMVAMGSVIGRQVAIRPKSADDWTEVSNLWGLLVGRPGLLKSPAMEEVLKTIKRLVAKAIDAYNEAKCNYEGKQKIHKARMDAVEANIRKVLKDNPAANVDDMSVWDAETEEPIMRRYIINDTSLGSLVEILRQNPNGVLVHRDEMISLLSYLDLELNQSHRGFYMTGWNGNSTYVQDRLGRGFNRSVPGICLSLLGAATPNGVQRYITGALRSDTRDDGLIQRFNMLVWPDLPNKWQHIDRLPDREAANAAHEIFKHLSNIDLQKIRAKHDVDPDGKQDGLSYLRYNIDAYDAFVVWRTKLEERLRTDDDSPAMQSHLAKYKKLVPALSLICHLADGGTGPVTLAALRRALAWVDYLETHAKRAYGSATTVGGAAAKLILAKLEDGSLSPRNFTARDIQRNDWSRLTDIDVIQAGLSLLVTFEYLIERQVKTGGRPSTLYTWAERA